jgi:hypothetical protein
LRHQRRIEATEAGPGVWFDEGLLTQTAMNLAERGEQGVQVAPDTVVSASRITTGFPLIGLVALSYRVFGVGVLQGRAVMAGFIVAFALASFLLVRGLFSQGFALMALLLLVTYPPLYGNGKSVLGEVPGLVYLLLTLFALRKLEVEEFKRISSFVLAGIAAGLCVTTKPMFILLLPAGVVAMLGFRVVREAVRYPYFWKGAVCGVVAFGLVSGLWVILQFGENDSVVDILGFYANPYSESSLNLPALIGHNFLRFVTELSPLHTLILLGGWSLGLLARYLRSEPISFAEGVAWWFSLFIILFFVTKPGFYRYFFPATMIAMLFAPYGAWRIVTMVIGRFAWTRPLQLAIVAVALLLIGLQGYLLVANSWVASYYGATRSQSLEDYFASFDANRSVFLYNVPEVAIFLPTRSYYQYVLLAEPLQIGGEQLSELHQGTADTVIVNTETYRETPEPFARYHPVREVNRYTVLERN